MPKYRFQELTGFDQLKFDWKIIAIIITSTLLLIVDSYHSFFPIKALDRMTLYLIIPMLIILAFRESPLHYGFRIGDWKIGLLLVLLGGLLMTIILLFTANSTDFVSYYSPRIFSILPYPVDVALDLVGWEFFFRGFLLFGLMRAFGPYAIILQAVPFAIAHIGKPEVETLSCIFGGTAFGYIAWRTKSFLYPYLLHWYISTLTIIISSGAIHL